MSACQSRHLIRILGHTHQVDLIGRLYHSCHSNTPACLTHHITVEQTTEMTNLNVQGVKFGGQVLGRAKVWG